MDSSALSHQFNLGTGRPFAAIRLPDESTIRFIYGESEPMLKPMQADPDGIPGFYFSPYGAGDMAYVMEATAIYENERPVYGKLPQKAMDETEVNWQVQQGSKESYLAYTRNALEQIAGGTIQKVVTARAASIRLGNGFSAASLFGKLCTQYPGACVYYFNRPGHPAWIGATPETLLTLDAQQITTVALAGTITNEQPTDWTQKEIEEQAVTAAFIREVLEQHKCEGFHESKVKSLEAGGIRHLRSVFSWNAPLHLLRNRFPKLLRALNPTPAVCGSPAQGAAAFIATHEQIERRFYSGFIGWKDGKGNIQLFVGLRCMEFSGPEGVLYAGAGINGGSDPEKEWEETERKMETLRRFF